MVFLESGEIFMVVYWNWADDSDKLVQIKVDYVIVSLISLNELGGCVLKKMCFKWMNHCKGYLC